MIDFSLNANTFTSKQKHPPIYHSRPWGRSFPLFIAAPYTLPAQAVSVSPSHRCPLSHSYDVWVGTVEAVRGRQSSETQLFVVLKLSSATVSSPVHSHRGHEQVRASMLAEGWGVHVIITRVGTSVCCPAVTLLLPALHSFSLIKVLPPDCLGDFWQTHVVITSSPHFSHPQEGARLPQSEQQKMSSKNAKIAWREGAALGYEGHVIWAACGCQCLPPTRHLMSRPAGKRLPYDPIIKQVHPGGSSLAKN